MSSSQNRRTVFRNGTNRPVFGLPLGDLQGETQDRAIHSFVLLFWDALTFRFYFQHMALCQNLFLWIYGSEGHSGIAFCRNILEKRISL